MRTQHETTILDDDGQPHAYLLTMHGAREGANLLPRLLAIAAGPMDALLAVAGKAEGELKVEGAIQSAVQALIQEGSTDLLMQLLKHTFRDGKPVSQVFDEAYQGNYGELAEAVWFAFRSNYWKSIQRVPFGQALGRLTRGLQG